MIYGKFGVATLRSNQEATEDQFSRLTLVNLQPGIMEVLLA
jgi:hypothetical protein